MKRLHLSPPRWRARCAGADLRCLAQAAPDAAKQKELDAAREDLHAPPARRRTLPRGLDATQDLVIERRLMQRPVLGVILEPTVARVCLSLQ
jgi:hypothetical protein